jgi:L-amino acid N-acyltransferase YncA
MSEASKSVNCIRLATARDADAIAEIYRPSVESAPTSFETEAPDGAEIGRRLEEVLKSHPWLVCELNGVVSGYAYATKHRARAAYQWSVDTAVYVDAASRRYGIGRALYTALFPMLTAQGYVNAYAGITLPNPGSVGLHEAVGFRALGVYRKVGFKRGAWHDVGWWELLLHPHPPSPALPATLDAVCGDPAWNDWLQRGVALVRMPDSLG